jgi:hypothetical protein
MGHGRGFIGSVHSIFPLSFLIFYLGRPVVAFSLDNMYWQVCQPVKRRPGSAICKQVYCKNKSFGGYRPIINLKRLNLADVEPKHFKMKI